MSGAARGIPPFFIVGTPRSGTTLVQGVLGAHSRLCLPPETFYFGKVLARARRFLRRGRIVDPAGFRRVVIESSELAPVVASLDSQTWERLLTPNESICRFLDGILSAYAHSVGKESWGEKTPSHLWYWKDIDRCFPGCRFVAVLRDGRDVVASLAAVPWSPRNLWANAHRWRREVRLIEGLLRRLGPTRVQEVRYEDFVRKPEETVERICRFLDVAFETGMLSGLGRASDHIHEFERSWKERNLQPIFTSSIGSHRTRFSGATAGRLTTFMYPELRRLGYVEGPEPPGAGFLRVVLDAWGLAGFLLQYGWSRSMHRLRHRT